MVGQVGDKAGQVGEIKVVAAVEEGVTSGSRI